MSYVTALAVKEVVNGAASESRPEVGNNHRLTNNPLYQLVGQRGD
jgi:hypothetical protein